MGVAQQYPIYQPALKLISSITQGYPTTITTTLPHQYTNGQIVRIFLPQTGGTTLVNGVLLKGFGMSQINNLVGTITNTNVPTVFTINIDSSNFDPFVIPPNQDPPVAQAQYAQVIPGGGDATQNAYIDVLPY